MQFNETKDLTKQDQVLDAKTASKTPLNLQQESLGKIQTSSAALTIPPAIAAKLSAFSKQYNLPFDLSQLSLDQITPEKIKAFRELTNMMAANSKLLPELIKQSKRLMRADISMAQAHGELAKAALKHQEKLDKNVADIFFACAQHQAKSSLLAAKQDKRMKLLEQRTQAQIAYMQDSVFAAESQLMETNYQLLADNKRRMTEAKIQQKQFNHNEKQRMQDYINSAFE